MSPEKGARTVLYCRVSTQEQAKSGLSLDHQEAKMRSHCETFDYEVAEVIRDEGESGKSLDRPGMSRVLDLVASRSVDLVMVYKLDRMTRKVRDLGTLLEDHFGKYDVALEAVTDRLDTSTHNGRLMMNILMSVAEWERDEAVERTRAALSQAKESGTFLGKPPVGWRVQDGKLVPDENRIDVVELVWSLKETGLSLQKIADELNQQGVPTGETDRARVVREQRAAKAGQVAGAPKWHKTTVARVLRAPLPPKALSQD